MTIAAAAATAAASTAATTGATALHSLAGNFTDFLKLLMTQLQNQDPTSPMDTNQFTTQLVQFSGVEQQINANSSLTKLIDATQGNTLLQSTSLVGKEVELKGDQLSLQGGKAGVNITATAPGQATVGIYSAAGIKLREQTIPVATGSNSWSWDGRSSSGAQLPDGAYKVAVVNADGASQPFTVLATATGVQRVNDVVKVQLGSLLADFSSVQSVGGR